MLAVVQRRPLNIDQLRQRPARPLLRGYIGAGEQHRRQNGSADGRRWIAGNGPGPDRHAQRRPFDGLVMAQIVQRQGTAGVTNVRRHRVRNIAFIKDTCAFVGDCGQGIRQVWNDHEAARVAQCPIFAMHGEEAVVTAAEDGFARVAEVIVTGRGQRETITRRRNRRS